VYAATTIIKDFFDTWFLGESSQRHVHFRALGANDLLDARQCQVNLSAHISLLAMLVPIS
jgi:phage FluMu protein gp41